MLEFRKTVRSDYADIITPDAARALEALARFDTDRKRLMDERIQRRAERASRKQPIGFLDPESTIGGTPIKVRDASEGKFMGSEIPRDLQRQWIQGTGPRPGRAPPSKPGIRNVAYALLSGADGWMFDGEDALGQVSTMSLDNQRNLKLAIHGDPVFMKVAEQVAGEMNAWAATFFGKPIIADWRRQLSFTTKIFRARGLHLDDRHIRHAGWRRLLRLDRRRHPLRGQQPRAPDRVGRVARAVPAENSDRRGSGVVERHPLGARRALKLPVGTIKTYVLVEQVEACFQLMEIRAALGLRFVGFDTGRWDYINSVSDAMAWDPSFVNPNIDQITMTYGYMRTYEDRVRRACNTPDRKGQFALWQGGMEPNIPVGSKEGVAAGMKRAIAGAEREQREGASGKWVAHWKMVHIVRPVWEKVEEANQLGRSFPRLTYTDQDAADLTRLEPAPLTVRGARDLFSVAIQYGNAFGQGMQAAALKPADFFGNDDVLYLMEDMATGEIRLSILWEWLHKSAKLTEGDDATGVKAGDTSASNCGRACLPRNTRSY